MRTIVSLLAAMLLSLDFASAATLRIVEATTQVLPKDFTTVTLQLIDWVNGRQQPVPIRSVDAVVLSPESGATDLTKSFALRADGSISANDDVVADEMLTAARPQWIEFRGVDGDGIPVAWEGQPGATFDVKTLIADPRLRTGELMRR